MLWPSSTAEAGSNVRSTLLAGPIDADVVCVVWACGFVNSRSTKPILNWKLLIFAGVVGVGRDVDGVGVERRPFVDEGIGLAAGFGRRFHERYVDGR